MVAEARALLDGMRIIDKIGIEVEAIYSDSLILVNLIKQNKKRPPWSIMIWWEEIQSYIKKHEWKVVHTYREGNTVADNLASLACTTMTNKDFSSWRDLPRKARGCAITDAAGLPSWRF